MTASTEEIAEAFSGHRFTEAFPYLDPHVRWVSVGGPTLEGRDAVVEACENTTAGLGDIRTEFTRFLSVVGTDAVAVDVIGRYTDPAGQTTVVSSCDIYEFDHGVVVAITSYTVELPG